MKDFALSIPGPSGTVSIPAPTQIEGIVGKAGPFGGKIIWVGIEVLLVAALLISLFMLIWGGVKWMTSGGNKQELDLARKTLVFSVIGLLIAILSFSVLNFLGGFFGVPIGPR